MDTIYLYHIIDTTNEMDYQNILNRIYKEVKPLFGQGKVADYIPALAKIPGNQFGMFVSTVHGEEFGVGQYDEKFSIQSISKVFSLTLAMQEHGDDLWNRVGREPSGTRFNSLVQLEYENGIPRNPFINAGAIVITDAIYLGLEKTKSKIIDFVRKASGNKQVCFNDEVAFSEKEHGHRNLALASFIKSFGNLHNDVHKVLETYFYQCSIEMNCRDLSKAFFYLANAGKNNSGEEIISVRQAKRINSLMMTCGLYDAVGDFAYWVGLPGKSGVGGGIVAIIPGEMAITVWSPELNKIGNSLVGTKALELFTTYTGKSIF